MNLIIAQNVLNIQLPITINALRSAFRRKSHETHPDKGGTDKQFIDVQNAFDYLLPYAVKQEEEYKTQDCLVDGTPLSELGLGFPLSEAARSCDICSGKGFISKIEGRPCTMCQGQGTYTTLLKDCPKCNGRAVNYPKTRFYGFGSLFGFNRSFACRHCNMTGKVVWLQLKRPFKCLHCNATGVADPTQFHYRCGTCNGIGEVRMWNPVLHRARLAK